MAEHTSIRVNGEMLPEYVGQTVRLLCKVIRFPDTSTAIVQSSDGVEIRVLMTRDANMTDTFVEVIGNVVDETTLKMLGCVGFGSKIDTKLVDDVTKLMHDPRFKNKIF